MNPRYLKLSLVLAALVLPTYVHAQSTGEQLVQDHNCLACHGIDRKRMGPGPPFVSIARRYAGAPQGVDYLARAIRSGSRGHWGAIPMPAQSGVSPDEALVIADWILKLDQSSGDSPGKR